jgi:CheY-like chemotaxis protein
MILEMVERACHSKNQPILIVDDNPDFVDALKDMLHAEGYQVAAAYSGEEALNMIDNINPSMMFLDLLMPGVDGFDVVQRLRAQEKWHNLPIVILSGADIEKGQFSKEIISSTIKKVIAQTSK